MPFFNNQLRRQFLPLDLLSKRSPAVIIIICFGGLVCLFIVWEFLYQGKLFRVNPLKSSNGLQDDLAIAVSSTDVIFPIGAGSFITVIPRRPLADVADVQIQLDDPDVISTISSFQIPNNSLRNIFIPLHSKKVAGHCTLTFQSNSIELKNLFKLQVHIKIVHFVWLGYISIILGWSYFICWSTVYYPQIYKNFTRKSVIGLSFDYLVLNMTGHICYFVFNTAMFYNSSVQEQYTILHPKGLLPVKFNDVLFSWHAVTMNVILVIQCCLYERGEQQLSMPMITLVVGLWIGMFAGLFSAISEHMSWLRYLYILSYIKVGTTPIKYAPQVYLHYLQKSTEGWSIHSVFLDFFGGIMSFLQMTIDAVNNDDIGETFGNPGKLGLAIITMVFDGIFMLQHFQLYASKKRSLDELDLPLTKSTLETLQTIRGMKALPRKIPSLPVIYSA